jgi:hypothetical protein
VPPLAGVGMRLARRVQVVSHPGPLAQLHNHWLVV